MPSGKMKTFWRSVRMVWAAESKAARAVVLLARSMKTVLESVTGRCQRESEERREKTY